MTSEYETETEDIPIRIRDLDTGREETLAVFDCTDRTWEYGVDAGSDYTLIEGIDPDDSDLLPASLHWHSGSFADTRSDDMRRFPSVFVPADGRFEIEVLDAHAGDGDEVTNGR